MTRKIWVYLEISHFMSICDTCILGTCTVFLPLPCSGMREMSLSSHLLMNCHCPIHPEWQLYKPQNHDHKMFVIFFPLLWQKSLQGGRKGIFWSHSWRIQPVMMEKAWRQGHGRRRRSHWDHGREAKRLSSAPLTFSFSLKLGSLLKVSVVLRLSIKITLAGCLGQLFQVPLDWVARQAGVR